MDCYDRPPMPLYCDWIQPGTDFTPHMSQQEHYANTPPVADMFATADDALFKRMLANQHHVLQPLLPDQSSHNYNLRNRRHQLQLTQITTHFNNKLFIIRLLFKDTY